MKSAKTLLSLLVAAGLISVSEAALASNAGAVTNLSGTLSVRKPDGSVRILSQKSEIQSGDTLVTQRDSYAQIKFGDGAQITLKPNTTVKIQNFRFDQSKPEQDNFVFSLLKGGLRAVSGLVGKRGDSDAYKMDTATATIGIRGTTYGADDCTGSAAGQGPCANVDPAVYVSVSDGEIVANNAGGTASYRAGQFGMIESKERAPRFLSTDPGLQFTPPASFIQSIVGGSTVNSGKALECVVRR
jgi:hypothetical protein